MSSFITYHQLIISFSTFNTPTINYPQSIAPKLLIFQFFILNEANNVFIFERFRSWFVIAFIELNQLIRLVFSIQCICQAYDNEYFIKYIGNDNSSSNRLNWRHLNWLNVECAEFGKSILPQFYYQFINWIFLEPQFPIKLQDMKNKGKYENVSSILKMILLWYCFCDKR